MRRCAMPLGRRSGRRSARAVEGPAACPRRHERGVALFAALAVMALVSALVLGLVLTTSLEPLASASFETTRAAQLAAEAGLGVAAHELGAVGDWNLVLGGAVVSAILDQSAVSVELPDGSRAGLPEITSLATCGHASACSEAEAAAFTADRPWGPNNPRWRVFGHARLDRLLSAEPGLPPIEVVVWTGDDPAELDGDPSRDAPPGPAGEWRPGACTVAIRAEAFAPRQGHATVLGTLTRPGAGCGMGARLASWHRLD